MSQQELLIKQARFARRKKETFAGMELNVAAPEDTILMKLHWCQLSGGSDKQFTDALRVFEVQHKSLDLDYIGRWAGQLGIADLWGKLQTDARPL